MLSLRSDYRLYSIYLYLYHWPYLKTRISRIKLLNANIKGESKNQTKPK